MSALEHVKLHREEEQEDCTTEGLSGYVIYDQHFYDLTTQFGFEFGYWAGVGSMIRRTRLHDENARSNQYELYEYSTFQGSTLTA